MITINFEAANGADLRKEMLALLGISGSPELVVNLNASDFDAKIERVKENLSGVIADEPKKEEVKAEQTTRKRRSQAEIKAAEEAPIVDAVQEEPAKDETTTGDEPAKEETPTAVTAEDLTKKCVELGRAGKRDAVLALFENSFGGATISKKDGKPQLTVDQYEAVMEALNAIG